MSIHSDPVTAGVIGRRQSGWTAPNSKITTRLDWPKRKIRARKEDAQGRKEGKKGRKRKEGGREERKERRKEEM